MFGYGGGDFGVFDERGGGGGIQGGEGRLGQAVWVTSVVMEEWGRMVERCVC